MKFVCLQENLIRGLSVVSKAVPIKAPLPILSNMLIETQNGRLRLSATNLSTTIITHVGASIEEEGAITIPAKLFHEFVSHLSPTTLSCEVKNDILHVVSERVKARFNGLPSSEFPELPGKIKKNVLLKLAPKEFSEAVSISSFATSSDESRLVLTGVLIGFKKGKLTLVGLDGFRLSEKSLPAKSEAAPFSVIIPSKALLEVARILGTASEAISFSLDEENNLAVFEADGSVIASGILTGEFPDYRKIIPPDHTVSAQFASADLLEAVRLANVFARDNNVITLALDPKGFIKVSSSHEETGANDSKIDATVEGEGITQSFNSRYLLDLLNNVKAQRFVLESKGGLTPALIKPTDTDDCIYVVAPVRSQNSA